MRGRPKVCAIVQARMGSQRLPGKVLATIGRASMLAHVVERATACLAIDEVIVATSDRADDEPVAAAAAALGVPCWRGSADDVLARYRGAADAFDAEVIVRLTADCPLLDPIVIGQVIDALIEGPRRATTPPTSWPAPSRAASTPRRCGATPCTASIGWRGPRPPAST